MNDTDAQSTDGTEQRDAKYAEIGSPHPVERRNDDVVVRVQEQVTRQGRTEYAASYRRITRYEDQETLDGEPMELEGVSLSLFIKDPETTRLLYECLREFFEERYDETETDRRGEDA